ncbi:MAG: phosphotransferase [Akkermansia sp.]
MTEIEIKGHSGCGVKIIKAEGGLVVVKNSTDKKYFERLLRQINKQKNFKASNHKNIKVPQILNVRQSEDEVSIEMEYIYSKNFIEYFEFADYDKIHTTLALLIRFIDTEIGQSPLKKVNSSFIQEKFDDVCKNVEANAQLKAYPEIPALMAQCSTLFQGLDATIELPCGTCHGDLTFSNMLFNNRNRDCYLIDFLDSFVESPIIDIVKIRQDTAFMWSPLLYNKSYDAPRLNMIMQFIDSGIERYYAQYDWYVRYYPIFQLMNFLRILQYAKEEKIITYLIKTIHQLV